MRRKTAPLPWDASRTMHCVGGRGDLTTIRKNGISTRPLVIWDDQIGEPVRPRQEAIDRPPKAAVA